MSESLISKIENGRAGFAFEIAKEGTSKLKEKYKSHVKSFPMLITTNGLGSAIAFLYSKRNKEKGVYLEVGNSIVKWLLWNDNYEKFGLKKSEELEKLTENIINLDTSSYRALTVEILSYFKWLRRFAEGFCKEGDYA